MAFLPYIHEISLNKEIKKGARATKCFPLFTFFRSNVALYYHQISLNKETQSQKKRKGAKRRMFSLMYTSLTKNNDSFLPYLQSISLNKEIQKERSDEMFSSI